jgi:hypothetical protein
MTITLRSLRARLNAADPRDAAPRARVARARDGLERLRAREAPASDIRSAEERLARAEETARVVLEARTLARLFVEDSAEEIAALFGVSPGAFAERLAARAAENFERDPSADEAETWRNLLGSLLTICDERIERERPKPPTIETARIVARAFLEAPSVETLRTLAETAHAAGAPGAAWGRIRDLLTMVPKGRPISVRVDAYRIEVAWPGAAYRFGSGHADDTLGIG